MSEEVVVSESEGSPKPNVPNTIMINIPQEQKYILCLLNSRGKPAKYIVFNGLSTPMTDEEIKQLLFSNDVDRAIFDSISPQTEFVNSAQQIHKDDTIRILKKKIIHELGKNDICYEELYLFGHQLLEVDAIRIVDEHKELFNVKLMSQLAINIQLKPEYYEELIGLQKDSYRYEDLIKYINKKEKFKVSIPLGQRFSLYRDYLFSGNPYDVEMRMEDPIPAFQMSKKNELYTFENQLLLNYGDLLNNVIYLCRAGDVLDYADEREYTYSDGTIVEKPPIDHSFLLELYYPLLHKAEITSKDQFVAQQQGFIGKNAQLLKPGTFQMYDTIDLFHNIYYSRKSELSYVDMGVSEFNILLHPDVDIPIPLDIIFKQMHARVGVENPYYPFIPMIKYNPGKRRESLFRFYSEFTSKDGRKIPWLQRKQINTISRENKKLHQMVLYVQYTTFKKEVLDIFVEIHADGNIRVRSVLNTPISVAVMETIIYNVVNPIIIKMNKILQKSGYRARRFQSLKDDNVEVIDLYYQSSIVSKNVNLKRVIGCLTSLFDITDTELDINKGIVLNFVRVDNYEKMNAISAMITEVFKRTNSRSEIIDALSVNFSLSREDALQEIVDFFNQHQRIHGQFMNKQVDIVDNPGFPVSIYKSPFDNKIQIKIEQINSIEFIEIMHMYMDSILRMLMLPQELPAFLLDQVKRLCSTIKVVEEEKIENVIVNKKTVIVQPVLFTQDSIEDDQDEFKFLPEGDEEGQGVEESEDGFLPEEEDQDEEEDVALGEDEEGKDEDDREQESESAALGESAAPIPESIVEQEQEGLEEEPVKEQEQVEGEEQKQEEEDEDEEQKQEEDEHEEEEQLEENSTSPSENELEGEQKQGEEEEESSSDEDDEEGFLPSDNESDEKNKSKSKGGKRKHQYTPLNIYNGTPSGVLLDVSRETLPINQLKRTNLVEVCSNSNVHRCKKGGAKEEKSNIFTKRMKEKEPNLILTKPQGKFVSYSRICPSNVSLQPVILTDEEKTEIDKEHSGAYTNAIKYGSDPKNQYWYICPRYWCLKTNKPMTEEEVKRGECGGKVIPDNAKPPPPGHFIYEFTDPKYHKNETGEYVWHSPGFKPPHSHPDSKMCLPCCYNNWASKGKALSQQQKRRQECGMVDANTGKVGPDGKKSQISLQTVRKDEKGQGQGQGQGQGNEDSDNEDNDGLTLVKPQGSVEEKKEKEKKKQMSKSNVFGIERYPIPQYRWGFLPTPVELFLQTKNNKYIMKSNPAYIQSGKRPLLRYGVEQSQHQSFVGVLADIYSSYANIELLTIEQMREKIIELLTLDDYLKLHNGSLLSVFKPRRYAVDDVTVEDHRDSVFYQQIDLYNPSQYAFLKDCVSSFNNFCDYLRDPDTMIDHTYLWDIISSDESVLFEGGLNMVIMEIVYNDVTDNIDVICPSNAYSSNIYEKGRGTILILKHDAFYEPIYLYPGKEKEKVSVKAKISEDAIKIFTDLTTTDELKTIHKVLNMIMETSGRKCKPINTRPRTYTFKENISAKTLMKYAEEIGFTVAVQVMNYQGKIIALIIEKEGGLVYLPCFPSKQLPKIKSIFMNAVQWANYVATRDILKKISADSSGKILCKPMMKVVEDEMIVGLLTETNQFVQLAGPEPDTFEDGLPVFQGAGYKDNKLDIAFATSKEEDTLRVDTVRNIRLETQFYISFRSEIRTMLNDYNYRDIREQIVSVLDNPRFLYTLKMKKVDILIRHLTKQALSFVDDIDSEIRGKVGELSNCNGSSNCDIQSFCLKRHGKACFPKTSLINPETDNELFYYARLCDELIRYRRIRLFMLNNKKYLNMSNVDYSINRDEVILLNSVLTDDYFEGLEPFQNNKYVKRISYELANPSKNTKFYQNYADQVPIAEQRE